jgi:hypothetical protein
VESDTVYGVDGELGRVGEELLLSEFYYVQNFFVVLVG